MRILRLEPQQSFSENYIFFISAIIQSVQISLESYLSQIGRLVERLIRCLVDSQDEIRINEEEKPNGATIYILVGASDLGKVIGKQGRTARALRTIVNAAGMKQKRSYSIDIVRV